MACALALLLTTVLPGAASASGDFLALPVPYRSQLDGNPYELADCGPASVAMILGGYGKDIPTMELRRAINKLQGTEGNYDAGSFIESLAAVSLQYGLRPIGLFSGGLDAKGKPGLRRWFFDEVRRTLEAGHPIVPQVWYKGLPGREQKEYWGDHYIVLTGYTAEGIIYHDPIDKEGSGAARRMTWAQLDKAWRNSDFPYAGVAVAGSSDRPSLLAPVAAAPPTATARPNLLRPSARAAAPGDLVHASYPGARYVAAD